MQLFSAEMLGYVRKNWKKLLVDSIFYALALFAVTVIAAVILGSLKPRLNETVADLILALIMWVVSVLMFTHFTVLRKENAKPHTIYLALIIFCYNFSSVLSHRQPFVTAVISITGNLIVLSLALLTGWWLAGLIGRKKKETAVQ